MDGEEVELAIRVEAALEDDRVEMRIEPERISKGLIGEYGSAGDGLGGSGGVELGDQREDQPGDEAEEPLVVTEEYPKSFGDREDELPMGKGKKQVLVEVLGEKNGPFETRTAARILARNRAATFDRPRLWKSICSYRQGSGVSRSLQIFFARKSLISPCRDTVVVASLLLSYGLQVVVHSIRATSFGTGALVGLVAWLAFVVTHSLNTQFEGRKPVLLLINNCLYALTYVVFGGVLAIWR